MCEQREECAGVFLLQQGGPSPAVPCPGDINPSSAVSVLPWLSRCARQPRNTLLELREGAQSLLLLRDSLGQFGTTLPSPLTSQGALRNTNWSVLLCVLL